MLGTTERLIGLLVERHAGNFPLWPGLEQVRVLPIGDEEPLVNYAKEMQSELRVHGKGNLGAKPRTEFVTDLLAAIKERRA